MKKFILQFAPLCLFFTLVSCAGVNVLSGSQMISESKFECTQKSDTLNFLFLGEKVDFEYERIGLLRVEGEQLTSGDRILDQLKYQAWNNCADALINITVDSGINSSMNQTGNIRTSNTFTGLAVRIVKDSTFSYQQNPYVTKDAFVTKGKNQINRRIGLSLLGAGLFTALLIPILNGSFGF